MARTLDLYHLVQQPEAHRDDEWEQAFLHAIIDAKVEIDGSESRMGPDGWPYLYVKTSVQGTEPVRKVFEWLSSRGIGLVVNGHKMMPDYIFPFGMVWFFNQTNTFVTALPPQQAGEVVIPAGQKMLYGPPSDEYLPPAVRQVLRDFLTSQGVKSPKVVVITTPDFSQVDLAFSIESLGNPEPAQHQAFAEALAWFLPMHYTLVLASEKDIPHFLDL